MDYKKCVLILGEQFYTGFNKNEETFRKLKSKYPLMYRKDKSFKDVLNALEKVNNLDENDKLQTELYLKLMNLIPKIEKKDLERIMFEELGNNSEFV